MVEEVEYQDGPSKMEPLTRKERGRRLMDQKANSVADMAVVLGALGGGGEAGGEKDVEKEGKDVVVEVRWKDLLDAEYAQTWPATVIHDVLDGRRAESAYQSVYESAYGSATTAVDDVKPVTASTAEASGGK